MNMDPQLKPTGSLITDALQHLSRLIRGEVELAKSEVSENIRRAVRGIAMLVVAVIVALVALNVLAGALVGWLVSSGMAPGWAALIVGGGALVVAIVLVLIGTSALKATSLAPTRATTNVRRDIETLKGSIQNDTAS